MAAKVKFLSVGPKGPFAYEKMFPEPVQSPSNSPTKCKHRKGGLGQQPVAGFGPRALTRSSSWSTEGLCRRVTGPDLSKDILSLRSRDSSQGRARSAVPPAGAWQSSLAGLPSGSVHEPPHWR